MVELFDRNKSTISRHIKNVFEEGNFTITASYGRTYQVVIKAIEEYKKYQAKTLSPIVLGKLKNLKR